MDTRASPERRHGSTRIPGHAFLAGRSSRRMVVYIYCTITYITKFFQLLSGQPVRYGKSRQYGPSITYKVTPAGSLSSSQPVGPPCWVSPLTFCLIEPLFLCRLQFCVDCILYLPQPLLIILNQKRAMGILYLANIQYIALPPPLPPHIYHIPPKIEISM
jgi:hypothetical protein